MEVDSVGDGGRKGGRRVGGQDEATIDIRGREVRIELDGLIEIGNRPIMAALLIPDQAAVAVDVDVSETESDRPIEVEERLIKCPFALPQDCPIMEYGGGCLIGDGSRPPRGRRTARAT